MIQVCRTVFALLRGSGATNKLFKRAARKWGKTRLYNTTSRDVLFEQRQPVVPPCHCHRDFTSKIEKHHVTNTSTRTNLYPKPISPLAHTHTPTRQPVYEMVWPKHVSQVYGWECQKAVSCGCGTCAPFTIHHPPVCTNSFRGKLASYWCLDHQTLSENRYGFTQSGRHFEACIIRIICFRPEYRRRRRRRFYLPF